MKISFIQTETYPREMARAKSGFPAKGTNADKILFSFLVITQPDLCKR